MAAPLVAGIVRGMDTPRHLRPDLDPSLLVATDRAIHLRAEAATDRLARTIAPRPPRSLSLWLRRLRLRLDEQDSSSRAVITTTHQAAR
jgi:hypothetical protein